MDVVDVRQEIPVGPRKNHKGVVMMSQSDKRYLEAIYIISNSSEHVHAIDISKKLQVTRASVSRAIKRLYEQKLVQLEEDKCIILTEVGIEKARKVYHKQVLLENFLAQVINVSEEVARKDASSIKHYMSDETCSNIQKFLLDY